MTVNAVELLDAWQPTVIKGNAAEIGALADLDEVCRCGDLTHGYRHMTDRVDICSQVKAQGVDSLGSFKNAPNVIRSLARAHRSQSCVPMVIPIR
jgi:thiamine-phosphate diphosphorylase / hydroxyethylthiazole kinase